MAPVALTRRGAVQAAAAAGLATATAGAGTAVAGGDGRRRHNWDTPVPEPIPGGVEIGPGQVIHVWAPGPPEITLPFTGFPFQGLNVEPTTIRDFKGFAAAGFHVGTATGADGTRYDFETDVRAFRGTYIDATGKRRFGTFGFI